MRSEGGKGSASCYVYALAGRGVQRRMRIHRRTLRTLDIGDIAVIFESRNDPPTTTPENLREQHAIVARLASGIDALLPARFGTLSPRRELEARVTAAQEVIRDALDRVRGRVQMSVRLHSSTTAPTRSPMTSGTTYLRARAERERKVRRQCARIARSVSRLVVDERIEPGKGTVEATVYHLIDAEDADAYRLAITKLAPSLRPDRIVVTGPWPVFAFAPDLSRGY